MRTLNIPESNKERVVIVGGGFGGLAIAKKLSGKDFQIVLLDKHNYHTFQPLLYQVATAGLEPDSIAYPLRKIFQKKNNFHFRVCEVKEIFPEKSKIKTSQGNLEYDHLILAAGSRTNYFGNENIKSLSMPLKALPQALDLRSLILQNFEDSLLTSDLKKREQLMNYVIVGGGPTGVELAGALGELKLHVLPADYPDLDFRRMSIHLLEASGRLLNGMSDRAGRLAIRDLEKLGVNVWLNTMVSDYDDKNVFTKNRQIPASTLIWAAGVTGNHLPGIPENAIERGRIAVDAHNKVEGTSNIYAIGDVALQREADYPNGHPMVAPVAIQQGKLLAKNLARNKRGLKPIPFAYRNKGSMATVGRNKAVVDFMGMHLGGFWAWMIWMFVHLMQLVGFRNRVIALFNWVNSYFSYDRGIRLIIRPYKRKVKTPASDVHADLLSEK